MHLYSSPLQTYIAKTQHIFWCTTYSKLHHLSLKRSGPPFFFNSTLLEYRDLGRHLGDLRGSSLGSVSGRLHKRLCHKGKCCALWVGVVSCPSDVERPCSRGCEVCVLKLLRLQETNRTLALIRMFGFSGNWKTRPSKLSAIALHRVYDRYLQVNTSPAHTYDPLLAKSCACAW